MIPFGRAWRLVVDDIDTTDLRVVFSVKKTHKKEPNTAEIRVYNLKSDNRKKLQEAEAVKVLLEAGYIDENDERQTDTLFVGQLRSAVSYREAADVVTTIGAGDKDEAINRARVGRSYAPFTDISIILNEVVKQMDVGKGNLSLAVDRIRAAGFSTITQAGYVISGRASDELDAFCRSAQLDWSVQDGELQFTDRGSALSDTAIKLSQETGLLGVPTVDTKGVLSCDAMLIPGLFPGRYVYVSAEFVEGQFVISEVEYTGDTWGGDWVAKIQGLVELPKPAPPARAPVVKEGGEPGGVLNSIFNNITGAIGL